MFYGIYGIGVDTRKSNDERETWVEELERGQGGGTRQGWLGGQRDGLMHLLAQRAIMMITNSV